MKRWLWDAKRRIYVDTSGNTLSRRDLTKGIDEYIDSIQEDMAVKVARYTAGEISVAELFATLADEITLTHGAAGSIAYGGLEQMDAERFARIDAKLETELTYLEQFRADVVEAASLPEGLSTEGIANRAGLYAEAAYPEFITQTIEREADNGVTLGRRICEDDNASCEECVSAATEEFIPLDDIPEIGSLQCMSNCRCEIEFSVDGVEFATSDLFTGVIGGQSAFGGSEVIQ